MLFLMYIIDIYRQRYPCLQIHSTLLCLLELEGFTLCIYNKTSLYSFFIHCMLQLVFIETELRLFHPVKDFNNTGL